MKKISLVLAIFGSLTNQNLFGGDCLSEYGNISLQDASLILMQTVDTKCLDAGVVSVLAHTWTRNGASCMTCEVQIAMIIMGNEHVTNDELGMLAQSKIPMIREKAREKWQRPLTKAELRQQKIQKELDAKKEKEEKIAADKKAIQDEADKREEAKVAVPSLEIEIEQLQNSKTDPAGVAALSLIVPAVPEIITADSYKGLFWTISAGIFVVLANAYSSYTETATDPTYIDNGQGGYTKTYAETEHSLSGAWYGAAGICYAIQIFTAYNSVNNKNAKLDSEINNKQEQLQKWMPYYSSFDGGKGFALALSRKF